MRTKHFENPFPATTYLGPGYFCDREEESSRLISNIQNGISTTLIALRRIGKTGLIHHVFTQLPREWKGIYVDILETENLNQFLNLLASAIIQAMPEKSSPGKQFWNLLRSLRPLISYDALTGAPTASFEISPKETEHNIYAILQFLEQQENKIVVAIDEFQQIASYPEKNTDAWLRTRIQQLKNVVFVFSGSQQHIMSDLFSSPQRPFFRSTQIMKLDKLNREVYCQFIVSMFNKYKKNVSNEIAGQMIDWANIHTFYVQLLCNRVFATTTREVTMASWKQQAHQLLREQEPVFFIMRNMLTRPQWQLLKAIAQEGIVLQPTGKTFLNRYHLGTSATVLRSLKTLLSYELIIKEFDANGASFYCVNDVFLQRWAELSH
ncbi:MAG: ATP-binding protein [Bacteroidetes bacterium]|nr:ATP-binding protein [Bacteroidota bacterium]